VLSGPSPPIHGRSFLRLRGAAGTSVRTHPRLIAGASLKRELPSVARPWWRAPAPARTSCPGVRRAAKCHWHFGPDSPPAYCRGLIEAGVGFRGASTQTDRTDSGPDSGQPPCACLTGTDQDPVDRCRVIDSGLSPPVSPANQGIRPA